MLTLPDSELTVWLRWDQRGQQIAQEIVDLFGRPPYEQCELQGNCDLKWETQDLDAAVQLAQKLEPYLPEQQVILVKAVGKVAGKPEAVTLKDERKPRK